MPVLPISEALALVLEILRLTQQAISEGREEIQIEMLGHRFRAVAEESQRIRDEIGEGNQGDG